MLILISLIAAALVFAFIVTWLGAKNRESLVVALYDFGAKRIDYLCRLWKFAGRRLLEKNFLSAVVKVVAGGVGVVYTDGQIQVVVLTLTLIGTFLFAPWENLPFETLDPPASPESA